MQASSTRRFVKDHFLALALALVALMSTLTLIVTLAITGGTDSSASISTDGAFTSGSAVSLFPDSNAVEASAGVVAPPLLDRADTISRIQSANAQTEVGGPVVSDVLDAELGPWWLHNESERSYPEHPDPVSPYR